jgi:hypothetical protein
MGVVVKHITEPVPEILKDMPELPPEADELIKMAMAKDKNRRYENTIELAKALNKIAFGEEGNLTFSTNSGVTSRLNSNNNTVVPSKNRTGLIVVGVVLVVALIGFFLIRNQLMPPEPIATATIEQPTLTTVPVTDTIEPVAFAPACSADVTFPVPEVRLTDNRCLQRRAYALFAIPLDTTFEALNPEATCKVESTSGTRQVVSCSGPNFLELDFKVCQPPPLTNEELNQCSTDSTFDSANQCCVAIPPQDAGCVITEVQMRGCE